MILVLQALTYHEALFTRLCMTCDSVIACRVTPAQKAQLVELVKKTGRMTLAIGDGGNDVSMIQKAHVGVGIRGKEGLQAARAADYAVSSFQSLQHLLFNHGRYSYMRTQLVAQYSFYKSFFFCMMQIVYAYYSGFAGTSLFNSLCITAYNAVLFVPIVFFVVNRDVPLDIALSTPALYTRCAQGVHLNFLSFVKWTVRGLWQALILVFIVLYSCSNHVGSDGRELNGDYESVGIVAFIAFLWVQVRSVFLGVCSFVRCDFANGSLVRRVLLLSATCRLSAFTT